MKFLSALAVGLMLAGSVSAEDVLLDCRIVEQCRINGDCFAAFENWEFRLLYEEDTLADIDHPLQCRTELLTISNTSISFECDQSLDFANLNVIARIDRISGAFVWIQTMDAGASRIGTTGSGQCSIVDRKF